MDFEKYKLEEGINWSSLKHMQDSPLDYKVNLEREFKQSDHMKLGSFVDCGLLTPNLLEDTYIVTPPMVWNSKAKKQATVDAYQEKLGFDDSVAAEIIAFKKDDALAKLDEIAKATGKICIPEKGESDSAVYTYERGMQIIKYNKDKPVFRSLFEEAEEVQKALFATCKITGLKLKGLVDVITTRSITDLKTIGTLGKMYYNIRAFGYIGQLAYYDYLARLNGIKKEKHGFVFIETTSPYKMKLMEVDPRAIGQAHRRNLELLIKLKECLDSGVFSDGSDVPEVYEYKPDDTPLPEEEEWLEEELQTGQDSL